jgi:outer membrane protein assembly factor BamB
MLRFWSGFALTLAISFNLSAADWPQFLGPNRDGTTPETVDAWKDELKPLWRKPVGEAHASPVVADGVVYIFAQPTVPFFSLLLGHATEDCLTAFDAKTGEVKWTQSYERPEFKPLFGNGPRSTPVVNNGKVFTFGGTGVLACWDAKTGEVVWKVDTLKAFKTKNLFFGISTSPIMVDKDKVVVMVGGNGAGVVAFDVKTGKPLWQATDDPASYSSPVLANKQLVLLTGANLLGLSTAGEKLWEVPFKDQLNESSTTPLVVGDVVIGSSVTAGSIAVRVKESGGKFSTDELWRNKRLTCYFSTPVVVGEYLYMVNGVPSLSNPTITLRCVELKTGKALWEKKNFGRYHAAIVRCGASGKERLLALDDNGYLSLLEPDAKEYKELARSKVCGQTWAHHALVDGNVYLRDNKELICLPLK